MHSECVPRYVVVDHNAMDADLIDVDIEDELINPRCSGLPGRIEASEFTVAVAVALDREALV